MGVFGRNSWFPRHGPTAGVTVPDFVADGPKALSDNETQASGRVGAKGSMILPDDKWMLPRFGGGY